MAYNTKYELNTVDSNGKYVKIAIQQDGYSGDIHQLRGTGTPATMKIRNDAGDYKGYIYTTSVDFEIYADDVFNLDNLITSDELEYRVRIDLESKLTGGDTNPIFWFGFIVPDFFREDLTSEEKVLSITASDRLGTLKNEYIDFYAQKKIRISDLIELCLERTGINLFLNYTQNSLKNRYYPYSVFDHYVYVDRFIGSEKNRISCYDILESLCILTNSILIQGSGTFSSWNLINKYHQVSSGITTFDVEIDNIVSGGTREIIAAANKVGIVHEFGEIRTVPLNYNFAQGLTGWYVSDNMGEVTAITGSVEKFIYTGTGENARWIPFVQTGSNTYLEVSTYAISGALGRVYSEEFDLSEFGNSFKVKFAAGVILVGRKDICKTGVYINVLLRKNGGVVGRLTENGDFSKTDVGYRKGLKFSSTLTDNPASLAPAEYIAKEIEGIFETDDEDGLEGYTLVVAIQTQNYAFTPMLRGSFLLDYCSLSIMHSGDDSGKGIRYETEQLAGKFSKTFDEDKSIFGDYIRQGLNGYFYGVSEYDLSLLSPGAGNAWTTTTPEWKTDFETEYMPVLQIGSRERARLFSAARDVLSVDFYIPILERIARYKYCGKNHMLIEGTYDFVGNRLTAILEEVKYSDVAKKDYIYTEFEKKD